MQKRENALRLTSPPNLTDDLPIEPFLESLRQEIPLLKNQGGDLTFGNRVISRDRYRLGLEKILQLAGLAKDKTKFLNALREGFDFYEVYGRDDWGDVLLTSYYEPEIKGSLIDKVTFPQPLYRAPSDLVNVLLSKYDDRFSDLTVMRGRLLPERTAAGLTQMAPYFSRKEIDGDGALTKRRLELAWVDPIDAFFLQIQGSGTVFLENGKRLRLGYADQNGQKYVAIGKFLTDKLPLEDITTQEIESHLRSLPIAQRRNLLFKNPSYIFFRELDGPPVTSLGTSVVAGRTIATDPRFFPKGAVGFLSFPKPRFDTAEAKKPSGFETAGRLVLDHDNGGAIRGGGRVDLFWGTGNEAKRYAGQIKHPAKLYYLVPKESR